MTRFTLGWFALSTSLACTTIVDNEDPFSTSSGQATAADAESDGTETGETNASTSAGDGDESAGDGDGDGTAGDGDGTAGDGDGTAGDGDGTTGDGDGTAGDGDGTAGDGDGTAGDGDGTAGDGDGTAGDGDGTATSVGDGDGTATSVGDGDGTATSVGDGDGTATSAGDGDGTACTPHAMIGCGFAGNDETGLMGTWGDINLYTGCGNPFADNADEHPYEFTVTSIVDVTVTMTPIAGDDLSLWLLEGECTEEACVDYAHTDGTEVLNFTAYPGETYFIVVDGWSFHTGPYNLQVTCV